MPAATARKAPAYVRRTTLGDNEYHNNFRKVDCETISRLTSEEATRITSQMCKVYLSLLNAPTGCWEREGVLRFVGEEKDGGWVTAWEQLVSLVGVASATARKALLWMHEEGIIGYFAGKNGVGIRVFVNRATSSIGTRAAGKKILEFTRASSVEPPASSGEAAFSDSFADSEVLEKDLNPRAPKSGAEQPQVVQTVPDQTLNPLTHPSQHIDYERKLSARAPIQIEVPVEEIVSRLKSELKPSLQAAAKRAAAQEHERTREWLENRGLPKAARVAQREAYNVLRKYRAIKEAAKPAYPVIGSHELAARENCLLSEGELQELAQACVAMFEVQGRPTEVTLSEMSVFAGGFLLPADIPRVRAMVEAILDENRCQEGRSDKGLTPKL
jgi:hypothetical protein